RCDTRRLVAWVGPGLIGASVALLIVNVWVSRRRGEIAVDDPWRAPTLEWATASPPPPGNFDAIPIVASRDPLWDADGIRGHVRGLSNDVPEVLVTTPSTAEIDHRTAFPEPSAWPL